MTVKLQLALDTLDGEKALRIAEQTAIHVDIIEAGTPLIKSVGIQIVSKLKESHPEKIILADLKSSDVGAYEAEMAFKAGADIVTTQGITTLATIREVQKEADKWGKRAEVDMTGVSDPVAKTIQVMESGVTLVLYHRSIDEEMTSGALWDENACQIVNDLCGLGIDVAIAGGINSEVIPLLCDAPVYAVVIGRGITAQDNPIDAAKSIRNLIDSTWN
jgi:3-hexulose-6-phosphate synthase